MNSQTTKHDSLSITVTAHEDASRRLLMASVTCDEPAAAQEREPLRVALVIDRSGSMSGPKLEITREAVARFIRTLHPEDRVAIVAYDDQVDVVCDLRAPSEELARFVERIEAGGSTNLYGGWVRGAKLVGRGGRVVLLSDGQANHGRFTDAVSLSEHAALSYQRYSLTTTTIGVGQDYDEALMAGMARHGGGAHYFAHSADAIMDAFSRERFSVGTIAVAQVSLRYGAETVQLGHFWGGETKSAVLKVNGLAEGPFTIRYTPAGQTAHRTEQLTLPKEFGYSDTVTLEWLLKQASEVEGEMIGVRDPRTAGEMRERLRRIVFDLLGHPSADEPATSATILRLQASMERLQDLERHYDETTASMHRKRSMQSSHNLRERAKSFSSFEDEAAFLRQESFAAYSSAVPVAVQVDARAFALALRERWIDWEAIPVSLEGERIVVAMEDPRDGFKIAEIERATGKLVQGMFAKMGRDDIRRMLERA